ncbi:MAG: hypothetical protein WBJ81_06520 [Rickettsiales bacterium]
MTLDISLRRLNIQDNITQSNNSISISFSTCWHPVRSSWLSFNN